VSLGPNSLFTEPDYRTLPGAVAGPLPLLHRLRSEDPVHWCEPMKLWLVTRYADVDAGLRDPRFSSDRSDMYAQALPPDMKARVQPLLDHLSNGSSTPTIPTMDGSKIGEPGVHSEGPGGASPADRGAGRGASRGPSPRRDVRYHRGVLRPLPATVICEMIGVPVGGAGSFPAGDGAGDKVQHARRAGVEGIRVRRPCGRWRNSGHV